MSVLGSKADFLRMSASGGETVIQQAGIRRAQIAESQRFI
jgi:hypothetical protein